MGRETTEIPEQDLGGNDMAGWLRVFVSAFAGGSAARRLVPLPVKEGHFLLWVLTQPATLTPAFAASHLRAGTGGLPALPITSTTVGSSHGVHDALYRCTVRESVRGLHT